MKYAIVPEQLNSHNGPNRYFLKFHNDSSNKKFR